MNKAFFTLAAVALLSAGASAAPFDATEFRVAAVSESAADATTSRSDKVARGSSKGSPATSGAQAQRGTYYWLHPKLGHVKVDRQTNAMVVN